MPNFYDYLKQLENINIFCFDMQQYNSHADTLEVIVMANYHGKGYSSKEIKLDIPSFCSWIYGEDKWKIVRGEDIIKIKGLQEIVDVITLEEGTDNG